MAKALEEQKQPPPEFDVSTPNYFAVTMFTSGYTDTELSGMKLNDRQIRAIRFLQKHEEVTNSLYQEKFGGSKATATRDLMELASKNLIEKLGTTGKGTSYRLKEREYNGS